MSRYINTVHGRNIHARIVNTHLSSNAKLKRAGLISHHTSMARRGPNKNKVVKKQHIFFLLLLKNKWFNLDIIGIYELACFQLLYQFIFTDNLLSEPWTWIFNQSYHQSIIWEIFTSNGAAHKFIVTTIASHLFFLGINSITACQASSYDGSETSDFDLLIFIIMNLLVDSIAIFALNSGKQYREELLQPFRHGNYIYRDLTYYPRI